MLKAPTCWGRLSQVLIKGSAKADLLLQVRTATLSVLQFTHRASPLCRGDVKSGANAILANAGQSMADPGNAAETLTNVLAGAGKTFSESPGAAPAQNNAPQLQSTGKYRSWNIRCL